MVGLVLAALPAEEGGFNPFQFDAGVVFWSLVVFAGALLPMWKFVFGPITRALDARDQRVEEAIRAADTARRESEEQMARTRAELDRARAEARRMVEEATQRAERQAKEALDAAKAEAERQLEMARAEIEAQKQRALEEIRREVVDLAIGSARAILQRDIDEASQRQLVDRFLAGAGSGGAA